MCECRCSTSGFPGKKWPTVNKLKIIVCVRDDGGSSVRDLGFRQSMDSCSFRPPRWNRQRKFRFRKAVKTQVVLFCLGFVRFSTAKIVSAFLSVHSLVRRGNDFESNVGDKTGILLAASLQWVLDETPIGRPLFRPPLIYSDSTPLVSLF
jgi:hypothetical protein